MPENIEEIEFTIFDTETTGLYPLEGDRVVELAGLRIKGEERLAVFDELINPKRAVSPGAFAVNKITPQMLENAPDIAVVIPKFLEFIRGSCLCSYNAEFDMGFLNNELKIIGQPPVVDIIIFDILAMARHLLPALPRYALWYVAKALEVSSPQKHRALADVEMTREVFLKLQNLCRQKGILDFSEFSSRFIFKPKNSGLH